MMRINKRSIAACILFSILTCGLYRIYWYYLLVKNIRSLTNDSKSCVGEMLCLTFVPLYPIYWWFIRGEIVKEQLAERGCEAKGKGIVYLVLQLLGLGIVSMAIMQHDFNAFADENPETIQKSAIFAMRKAYAKGFRLWKHHFGESVDYSIIVLCIALMPVVPLMFLNTAGLKWFALLCVVLFVCIVLPARSNAAVVLRDVCYDHDSMNSAAIVFGGKYRKALLRGLRTTLALVLWSLPGIAATVFAYIMFKGGEGRDVITIIKPVMAMVNNDIMKAIQFILLIYLACWLPLLFGIMIHGSSRHTYAAGSKVLRGRRAGYFLTWILSLAVFLPFVITILILARSAIAPLTSEYGSLKSAAMSIVMGGAKIDVGGLVSGFGWKTLIAFAVLFLPAVPLRHLIIASYVHAEN